MRRRFFWALLAAMATTLLIVAILGGLATLAAVRDQTRTEMERQITPEMLDFYANNQSW